MLFIELFTMMVKMCYMMRVFIRMAKTVRLAVRVFKSVVSFLLFFLCWIVAQAIMFMVLEVDITEQDDVSMKFPRLGRFA